MSRGSVANTLVLCVGIPLTEVAVLARSVARGTVVMAAGDLDTAWNLLRSADRTGIGAGEGLAAGPDGSTLSTASTASTASTGSTGSAEAADDEPSAGETIRVGGLTIDPPVREVLAGDRPVRLSAREFDLLSLLASDLHRVWSFAALVRELWDTEYLGDHEQLASTVKRLRKRLGPDTGCEVHSVHGVGYRLLISEPAVA